MGEMKVHPQGRNRIPHVNYTICFIRQVNFVYMHTIQYLLFRLLKAVVFRVNLLAHAISNYYSLVVNKVQYSSYPEIKGRLQIKNKGLLILGKKVKFNCATTFNYVGINKRCSMAIQEGALISIGENSGFSGVSLFAAKSIIIGSYVNCGGNVSIWDTDFHPLDYKERRIHNVDVITSKPVVIGDDVFIGANSMILKGVTIGARSIVGAGSVVTKNIPADEVWAGNPAAFIKKITDVNKPSDVFQMKTRAKAV